MRARVCVCVLCCDLPYHTLHEVIYSIVGALYENIRVCKCLFNFIHFYILKRKPSYKVDAIRTLLCYIGNISNIKNDQF